MSKQGDGTEQIATSAHLKPGRGGKRSQIKSHLLGGKRNKKRPYQNIQRE